MLTPKQSCLTKGFTLIELLVVVAIIALLISILLPSLSQARQTAQMVKCQAIAKQFSQAHHMYANNAEDWFVPVEISGFGGWYRWIQYRQLLGLTPGDLWTEGLVCPSVPEDRAAIVQFNHGVNGTTGGAFPVNTAAPWATGDRTTGGTATGTGTGYQVFRGKVRMPSTKLHMNDGQAWRVSQAAADYVTRWDLFPEQNPNVPAFAGGTIHASAYRHNEGSNVTMFDGHVEYRSKTDVFAYTAAGAVDNNKNNNLWQPYR